MPTPTPTPTPTTASADSAEDGLRSRLPDPVKLFPEMVTVAQTMAKVLGNGVLPQSTVALVQLRAGQLVGSSYHVIGQARTLRKAGEPEERVTAVASWRDAPYFTDAERVALELVEAVLSPNPHGERVPDELFARAAEHYDEKALWTLVLAISQISFFIPVALIAKPVPGRSPGQNYTA
ncbi:carboxymuconolactone decarboxylase family protein [Streptomyces sp. NPDC048172]|uniref:carboxymuconolactone decarboxylase family protein n=1 Tax=Streptomyces sp. NPDC048172 TaxID=3365505 RepID=UPI003723B101